MFEFVHHYDIQKYSLDPKNHSLEKEQRRMQKLDIKRECEWVNAIVYTYVRILLIFESLH